jgi:hypothetical protein
VPVADLLRVIDMSVPNEIYSGRRCIAKRQIYPKRCSYTLKNDICKFYRNYVFKNRLSNITGITIAEFLVITLSMRSIAKCCHLNAGVGRSV